MLGMDVERLERLGNNRALRAVCDRNPARFLIVLGGYAYARWVRFCCLPAPRAAAGRQAEMDAAWDRLLDGLVEDWQVWKRTRR